MLRKHEPSSLLVLVAQQLTLMMRAASSITRALSMPAILLHF